MLEAILEIFWICFDNFRDIAKTGKIARRPGESIKMQGPGSQEWHQNQKKTHRNLLPNLKRKIIQTWSQNGGKMELTWSQKGIQKSMFFVDGLPDASGDIGGTVGVTLSPTAPPGRRHIIKEYCTITSKDRIAYKI